MIKKVIQIDLTHKLIIKSSIYKIKFKKELNINKIYISNMKKKLNPLNN